MTPREMLKEEFQRGLGDGKVLVPMLVKLSRQEAEALCRFVQALKWDVGKYGRRI